MAVEQARQFTSRGTHSLVYHRLSSNNYTGVVLSREAHLPLVLEYNGSEAGQRIGRSPRDHDLAVLAEEVCLKHAHLVVTVSEVLKEELIQRGVEPDRIVCYPNGIDPEVFDPAHYSQEERETLRARHGIPADATVVTFLGTFGVWHGVEVLAEAIREMVDQDTEWLQDHKVHFLLIGDGACMPRVRDILSGERCDLFVTLTGLVPQDEAPAYLATSDIVVASHVPNADGSRFIGSPTKLFEYMAMGKGIVASDLDQLGQVLEPSLRVDCLPVEVPRGEERELAVLTQPGDRAGLMAGMRFLVEQPAWRRVLGQNARAEVLARYTWDHHVDAILQRLEDVVGGTMVPGAELGEQARRTA
jgi:glycosyltransferase involved in cell wall biosynthesis